MRTDDYEISDDEEVFVVERIVSHRKVKGVNEYLLKWEGYAESENTWETEDNIIDKDMIKKFWDDKKKASIKRNKSKIQSASSPNDIKPRLGAKRLHKDMSPARKNKAAIDSDDEEESWEEKVDEIDTIDRVDEVGLIVFIKWKDGSRSSHPVETIYNKCPQKMLRFYESRLRFRPG